MLKEPAQTAQIYRIKTTAKETGNEIICKKYSLS
jgi:hypothetical protein